LLLPCTTQAWALGGDGGRGGGDFTVTDPRDTGAPGQYRTGVNAANADAAADRILFNVSPAITSNLTITNSLVLGGIGSTPR
jgi:hypothetical protein